MREGTLRGGWQDAESHVSRPAVCIDLGSLFQNFLIFFPIGVFAGRPIDEQSSSGYQTACSGPCLGGNARTQKFRSLDKSRKTNAAIKWLL